MLSSAIRGDVLMADKFPPSTYNTHMVRIIATRMMGFAWSREEGCSR